MPASSLKAKSDKLFLGKAVDILIEKADVKLPDAFMKRFILEQNEGKMTAEQLDMQYDSYSNSLKWQILQNKIITDHKIEVSPEDVKNHVRKFISGQYFGGMEENEAFSSQLDSIVDNVLKNEEEVKKIYDQLYEEKILTLLKESLSLIEETVSLDDFIKKASETPTA